jgi:uncharacterized protein (DUF302 family)
MLVNPAHNRQNSKKPNEELKVTVRKWWLLSLLLIAAPSGAAPDGVHTRSVDIAVDEAYTSLYAALEEEKFWVVFEANMGQRMANMADRWGKDYNRQGLSAIKSMVFCNIDWPNRLASVDPALLSLCPLHMSLYEKDGRTTITMLRPSTIAAGSPGLDAAKELEKQLIGVIDKAVSGD